MSQEPVKEGPFHAEPWGGGGSWAVQPGPIWEEGEFFFFSSPGEKEARRFAKDMNWAYALGQAALMSQPDEKCGYVSFKGTSSERICGEPFVGHEKYIHDFVQTKPAPPIAQDTMRDAFKNFIMTVECAVRCGEKGCQCWPGSLKQAKEALAAHPTGQQTEEMNRFGYEKYQEGRRAGRSEATGQQEAVAEMDALAYAVLDCFPISFNKKWLAERKAEYAELHAKLSSSEATPDKRDATQS